MVVQYLWCLKKCSISHACGFTDCAFPLGLKNTFPAFSISWWLSYKFSAFANSLAHFLLSRKINIKQAVLYIYLYILKCSSVLFLIFCCIFCPRNNITNFLVQNLFTVVYCILYKQLAEHSSKTWRTSVNVLWITKNCSNKKCWIYFVVPLWAFFFIGSATFCRIYCPYTNFFRTKLIHCTVVYSK